MAEQSPPSGNFVKAFIPGLIVGFVVGALVGVVITATEGDVSKLAGSNEGTTLGTGERGERDGIVEQTEDAANEAIDATGDAIESGADAVEGAVKEAGEAIDDAADGVRDTINERLGGGEGSGG